MLNLVSLQFNIYCGIVPLPGFKNINSFNAQRYKDKKKKRQKDQHIIKSSNSNVCSCSGKETLNIYVLRFGILGQPLGFNW